MKKDFLDKIPEFEADGNPSLIAYVFGKRKFKYDLLGAIGLLVFVVLPIVLTFKYYDFQRKVFFENNLGIYPRNFKGNFKKCNIGSKRFVFESDSSIDFWDKYYHNETLKNNWVIKDIFPHNLQIINKCGLFQIQLYEKKKDHKVTIVLTFSDNQTKQ